MSPLLKSLVLSLALAAPAAWSAVEVKGVRFEDSRQVGTHTLQRNGTGVRVKLVFDVYAASLYLPRKESSAATVMSMPGPKSLQIVLLRELSGEEFADAMMTGFRQNHSEADQARYKARLEEVRSAMMAFGKVRKGTVVHFELVPGVGTQLLVNGERKGTPMAGEDFYNAMLAIWLGEQPVDKALKAGLLGGS
ncbi:MAG: chalcone isomerase family protein [Aquabacterium sp.]